MRRKDQDQEYLVGCLISGVVGLVILACPLVLCLLDVYGPKTVYTSSGLNTLFIKAVIPASIVGCLAGWFGRIPGAFGAFGGFSCGAAYWFLHLQQTIAKAPSEIGKFTEYLDSTMWVVPLGWIAIGAVFCFLPLLRKTKVE